MQGKNKTQYIRENTEEFGTFQKLFNMNQQKNIEPNLGQGSLTYLKALNLNDNVL